jgi:small neutral amino acid transporter SnatA (MarC family)
MKRLHRLKNINHLFAKITVTWCVFWGTACCVYSLRILSRTGYDAASLLGVILAFLGGELVIMCLRTILSEKSSSKKETKPQEGQKNKRDC